MVGEGGGSRNIDAEILPWNTSHSGNVAVFVITHDSDSLSGIAGILYGFFTHDVGKGGTGELDQSVAICDDLPCDVGIWMVFSEYVFAFQDVFFYIGKVYALYPRGRHIVTGVAVADNLGGIAGFLNGGIGTSGYFFHVDVRKIPDIEYVRIVQLGNIDDECAVFIGNDSGRIGGIV